LSIIRTERRDRTKKRTTEKWVTNRGFPPRKDIPKKAANVTQAPGTNRTREDLLPEIQSNAAPDEHKTSIGNGLNPLVSRRVNNDEASMPQSPDSAKPEPTESE
jgi:hypothetical protein